MWDCPSPRHTGTNPLARHRPGTTVVINRHPPPPRKTFLQSCNPMLLVHFRAMVLKCGTE